MQEEYINNNMKDPSTINIRLLALGGTISMSDGSGGARPAIYAAELARDNPRITSSVDVAFIGGSQVDFETLSNLITEIDKAIADGVDGVVITLGTDAIEETAAWVTCSGPWRIPVVLTGSMIPGKSSGSDGLANLSDAVAVASDPYATEPVVVFGGRIFLGSEVLKVSGMERMAFDAPGRGPVGVVLVGIPSWHRPIVAWDFTLGRPGNKFPSVPLLVAALGDDGVLVSLAASSCDALVIAGNGAGNLPPGQASAVIQAVNDGKLVVVASRAPDCRAGPMYGYLGGSTTLEEAGVIVVSGLSPHRARVVLLIGLSKGLSLEELGVILRNKPALGPPRAATF